VSPGYACLLQARKGPGYLLQVPAMLRCTTHVSGPSAAIPHAFNVVLIPCVPLHALAYSLHDCLYGALSGNE